MSNIKLEAMKEKIKDVLEKHYFGRNRIEENCANELLDLYNVSKCSECNDDMTQDDSHFCCNCYLANN